jgi:hypothetical protein
LACALVVGVVAGGIIATGPAFAATNFTVTLGSVPSFTAGGAAQNINYVLQRSGTSQQVSITQRAIYIQIAGIELPDVTVTRIGGQSLPIERVDANTVRAVRTDPTSADGGTRTLVVKFQSIAPRGTVKIWITATNSTGTATSATATSKIGPDLPPPPPPPSPTKAATKKPTPKSSKPSPSKKTASPTPSPSEIVATTEAAPTTAESTSQAAVVAVPSAGDSGGSDLSWIIYSGGGLLFVGGAFMVWMLLRQRRAEPDGGGDFGPAYVAMDELLPASPTL